MSIASYTSAIVGESWAVTRMRDSYWQVLKQKPILKLNGSMLTHEFMYQIFFSYMKFFIRLRRTNIHRIFKLFKDMLWLHLSAMLHSLKYFKWQYGINYFCVYSQFVMNDVSTRTTIPYLPNEAIFIEVTFSIWQYLWMMFKLHAQGASSKLYLHNSQGWVLCT